MEQVGIFPQLCSCISFAGLSLTKAPWPPSINFLLGRPWDWGWGEGGGGSTFPRDRLWEVECGEWRERVISPRSLWAGVSECVTFEVRPNKDLSHSGETCFRSCTLKLYQVLPVITLSGCCDMMHWKGRLSSPQRKHLVSISKVHNCYVSCVYDTET